MMKVVHMAAVRAANALLPIMSAGARRLQLFLEPHLELNTKTLLQRHVVLFRDDCFFNVNCHFLASRIY